MRWARRGLELRLALALVATAAVTLLAATFTLLPPLQHRLEQNRLRDLRQLARTARLGLGEIELADLRKHSAPLRTLVREMVRETGGRILIYDQRGDALVDTDADRARPTTQGLTHHGRILNGVQGDRAIVFYPVRLADQPVTLVFSASLGDTRAAAAEVQRGVLGSAAVGLGVAALLAVLLSSGLLRRLRRLREDAHVLGEEGLEHEVRTGTGRDEIAEVATALEGMRRRLVSEEAARQAFLSTASHELRTPLASLRGTLELLREQLAAGAEPAATIPRAETALRQSERLAGLAADLLDLGRLDAEVVLRDEPLELGEVVRTAAREFVDRGAAAGREVEIATNGPVHALADPMALTRIVRIVIDNALAHGTGTVRVAVARRGALAAVTVSDQGPGISAEDRERLFLRFERGPGAEDTAGFGLGLPIARGLARRMHGDLVALDVPHGACLDLTLESWSP
jgi:signal transduction histidine kinase